MSSLEIQDLIEFWRTKVWSENSGTKNSNNNKYEGALSHIKIQS